MILPFTMNILQSKSLESIGIRWGLLTFSLLSLFFLLMGQIGLIKILELRFFNAFIMLFGCYMAIREAKKNLKNFKYFSGLAAGGLNGLVASVLFVLAGYIYISFINPEFMYEIKLKEPLGLHLNVYLALFQFFVEGVISGFILSFIIMQWMKKPRTQSEEKD